MGDMKEQNQAYFEEKFKRVFDKLEHIHTEVKRTNGRVTKLEDQVKQIELHDREDLCPNTEKVQKIEEELMEYRFVRKYPRVFLIGAVIFGVSAIILFLGKLGIF